MNELPKSDIGKSGIATSTASGQNQMFSSGTEVAALTQSGEKGGMRGLALLAMVAAELALKAKALALANDYYKTNKRDYDFFRTAHQPAMQETAEEAFGPLNPSYNYDLYASVPAGIAKAGIIDRQWYEARRRIPKYNVGQNRRLDYDMAVARVAAVAAGWNIAVRYELNWTDEHNNRRLDRKVSVGNIGIGMGNIVSQGLSAAVSNLENSYDKVGDTIASIGNGYTASRGYASGREDTRKRYISELPKGMKNGS